MKKFLSIIFALMLVMSMGTLVFAAKQNQDASFNKTYTITNEGTTSPKETFTFTFTADRVTDSNANLTKGDMPKIPDSTVTFEEGDATSDGLEKPVNVALDGVKWPGVGVYYYMVNETSGNTAGVLYDNTEAYLKVTVAYDEGTNTYYTAFVTLNLADENGDGKTDSKVAGFKNVYEAGTLKITKAVSGNLGDQNAYFAVDVTLTGETGKDYLDAYEVTGGSSEENPATIAINEKTTFYLKHGETITIANLPYGVTYEVVEQDYTTADKGGYDEARYAFDDEQKKIDTSEDTVTITNNKSVGVDTGVFMDSLPYILLLVVACAGLVVFFARRRMTHKG